MTKLATESCVACRPDAPAVIWEGEEDGNRGSWSFGELRDQVGRAADALRALGVGPGDRVGIFMPLTPECAEGYSWMAGVARSGVHVGSSRAWMAVTGREESKWFFAFQIPPPSAIRSVTHVMSMPCSVLPLPQSSV